MRRKLLAFVVFAALPCFGQTFGEITGVVTDPAGALVVGAALTVSNPATNLTRTATTNNAGNYTFPSLLPGVYSVKAEMAGFQGEIRGGVELQVQQVARIDFQLKVGSLTETVEVIVGAPLLNTENATVGTVIENRRIVDLPLNGRNFISLIGLSPNVNANFANSFGGAGSRQGGDRTQQQFSVAGMRREFNYFTLDGVANSDVNFNTYLFLPSIDALQEFKVQTGVYSAEFGHEAAQVNVSTKGGTNEYHGALFEFFRNSNLDARPYAFTSQVPDKSPFKWNQYGFTLGGPVQIPKLFNGKNRLFFMSNYEKLQHRKTTEVSTSVAPVAMRNGDFSAAGSPIFDPLSRTFNSSGIAVSATQFPDNVIPASRFDPASLKLLNNYYPTPNQPGSSLVRNYLRNAPAPYDTDQFTQRIDWIENNKSSWFGRYTWNDDSQTSASTFLTDDQHVATTARQGMLSNTRILSASMVNEARFAWTQFHNDSLRYF